MTLKVRTFSPARVPKLNQGLLLIRRQVEGNFGLLPFVCTLAFGGFLGDTLSRPELLDIEFLAEAAIKPKFKRIPDLGTTASRIRCPPLRKF